MLRACAREMQKLQDNEGLVWVDLGGGTGQNVETMAKFCDLSLFKKVYVVDICGPLCDIARKTVAKHGWTNVEVVEADVCEYKPEATPATLVTFSYSLSSNQTFGPSNICLIWSSHLGPEVVYSTPTQSFAMKFKTPIKVLGCRQCSLCGKIHSKQNIVNDHIF